MVVIAGGGGPPVEPPQPKVFMQIIRSFSSSLTTAPKAILFYGKSCEEVVHSAPWSENFTSKENTFPCIYLWVLNLLLMSIKLRLTVMNFLEFFVWGSWLISLGGYMFTLPGDISTCGALVGATYGTMGIASLFMPTLAGHPGRPVYQCRTCAGNFVTWLAQPHCSGASTITDASLLYYAILLTSLFFMPTIALNNTVSYSILASNNIEIQKYFRLSGFGERLVLSLPCGALTCWAGQKPKPVFVCSSSRIVNGYLFAQHASL